MSFRRCNPKIFTFHPSQQFSYSFVPFDQLAESHDLFGPSHIPEKKKLGKFLSRSENELTFKVEQLVWSFRWLIDKVAEGVRETLLPKDDAFLFLGVLLKEKALPTLNLVRVASLKAFDNVPRFTSWMSMPTSCDWTLITNFSLKIENVIRKRRPFY